MFVHNVNMYIFKEFYSPVDWSQWPIYRLGETLILLIIQHMLTWITQIHRAVEWPNIIFCPFLCYKNVYVVSLLIAAPRCYQQHIDIYTVDDLIFFYSNNRAGLFSNCCFTSLHRTLFSVIAVRLSDICKQIWITIRQSVLNYIYSLLVTIAV